MAQRWPRNVVNMGSNPIHSSSSVSSTICFGYMCCPALYTVIYACICACLPGGIGDPHMADISPHQVRGEGVFRDEENGAGEIHVQLDTRFAVWTKVHLHCTQRGLNVIQLDV